MRADGASWRSAARRAACGLRALSPAQRVARMCARARGSLRSGRGGRRGHLAPCRGPLEGARGVGILTAIGYVSAPTSAWPLIRPARGHPARTRPPGPHARSLGERPRRSATPPPAPYLWCRDERDPEGSCAGAPSRTWLQQWRLRSLDSRRLRCGAGGRGAEDREARRFARGACPYAWGTIAYARGGGGSCLWGPAAHAAARVPRGGCGWCGY
jgi:hypothetical protein